MKNEEEDKGRKWIKAIDKEDNKNEKENEWKRRMKMNKEEN